MSNIFDKNEALKSEIEEQILSNMPKIERRLLDDIFQALDQFDTVNGNFSEGILTSEKLLEIENIINEALAKSGYIKSVDLFIGDMGKITINSSGILDTLGYSTKKLPLSDLEKKWKRQTAQTLLESGISEDFKRPVLRIIDEAVSYGNSITTAKNQLKEYIVSGKDKSGRLKSYVTQTARDSISQMQGQQIQSVANEVGYVGITYTGGLLKDSRGQCTHWVNDLKGFIPKEQLAEEIRLAYKNQAAKLEKPKGHKWGGMMPNTTVDNFLVKRGGYNCTHTAYPKRKK